MTLVESISQRRRTFLDSRIFDRKTQQVGIKQDERVPTSIELACDTFKLLPHAIQASTKLSIDVFLKHTEGGARCGRHWRHCLPFGCAAECQEDIVDVRRLSKSFPEDCGGLSENAILGFAARSEPPITLRRTKSLNRGTNYQSGYRDVPRGTGVQRQRESRKHPVPRRYCESRQSRLGEQCPSIFLADHLGARTPRNSCGLFHR